MSNDRRLAGFEASSGCADQVRPGGGRPPDGSDSTQIRPLTGSTQIFKIPDDGDLALQQFIIEKISFHIALFPYVDLPNQETH